MAPPNRPPARPAKIAGQVYRALRPWYNKPGLRLAVGIGAFFLAVVWLARDDGNSTPNPGRASSSAIEARGGVDIKTVERDLSWSQWKTDDGLKVAEIALPLFDLIDLLWIDGGDDFVTAETTGILHRVHLRSLQSKRQLKLDGNISSVALSRAGLLVVLPDSEEVLIVDPKSFEVNGSVRVPGIDRVTSSPKLDLAFGTGTSDDLHSQPSRLTVIDLSSRSVLRQYLAKDLWDGSQKTLERAQGGSWLSSFNLATVTPDGRYLVCSSNGSLHRFLITGQSLSYEAVSQKLGQRGRPRGSSNRLPVSLDSLHVLMPAGSNDSYSVVPVTNLEAAFRVSAGIKDQAISFQAAGLDAGSGRVLVTGKDLGYPNDRKLIVVDVEGRNPRVYTLTGPPVSPVEPRLRHSMITRVLVHPDDKGAILWFEEKLLWVKWPFGGLR